jgi:hypothetical protein
MDMNIVTLSLPGTPDKATGNLAAKVFCIIEDEAATPQTVPMERKRYTIDVDTACSVMFGVKIQKKKNISE